MGVLTQTNYISHVLINEIGDVVDHHKWLSFILICSGIEFLGGCIDRKENNLNASGRSKQRFNAAILNLFPEKYHQYVNTGKGDHGLYSWLRCGVNHVTLPGLNVALSERNSQILHLSLWNNRLALIAEDFYDDFKVACEAVITMLDNGSINETFFIGV